MQYIYVVYYGFCVFISFRLNQSQSQSLAMLKTDRFLADADWSFAERACDINNPYTHNEFEVKHFYLLCFFSWNVIRSNEIRIT